MNAQAKTAASRIAGWILQGGRDPADARAWWYDYSPLRSSVTGRDGLRVLKMRVGVKIGCEKSRGYVASGDDLDIDERRALAIRVFHAAFCYADLARLSGGGAGLEWCRVCQIEEAGDLLSHEERARLLNEPKRLARMARDAARADRDARVAARNARATRRAAQPVQLSLF